MKTWNKVCYNIFRIFCRKSVAVEINAAIEKLILGGTYMEHWLIIVLIVFVILAIACFVLYRKGKELQEKSESSQEQMRAGAQTQSLLVIDKKRMKLKEANLPKIVVEQTPKYLRRSKVPVVKAKIGPKIVTMICDEKIFDLIPIKKEVKAVISGIYIMDVKGLRTNLEAAPKKKGFMAKMRAKAEALDAETKAEKENLKKNAKKK